MRQTLLAPIFIGVLVADICIASDEPSSAPDSEVTRAIRHVEKPPGPSNAFGNLSNSELQVVYRLASLRNGLHYNFKPEHAAAWMACMIDDSASMYARLCAAFFLLDEYDEAKQFILAQLESDNLRHRYNAAETVRLHVRGEFATPWDIDVLIKLLADGTIDGSGITSSPNGQYPERDRNDIMHTPIDAICGRLGGLKVAMAVPALIAVLERRPETGGAASALGAIGDQRAIPVLMRLLHEHSGDEDDIIRALSKLKCKEAVPEMLSRLGHPGNQRLGGGTIETENLLTALLEIGDRRAIGPIEEFLAGDFPLESKAVARRVLVQLKDADPVAGLLVLLAEETYEPERSDIIAALAKHRDKRVVEQLADISRTSDSAFMRREAILGLRQVGNRSALLALASLLDIQFANDLRAEWGWKGTLDSREYFPETIVMCLQQCTTQDFGRDRTKWEEWINEHVDP